MNKIIKKEFIKNLTDGSYDQCQGKLHNNLDQSFCCLGVLADMYIKATGKANWDSGDEEEFTESYTLHTHSTGGYDEYYPPKEVVEWAGLDYYPEGRLCSDLADTMDYAERFKAGIIGHLAKMNDMGKSFKEIAKFVEDRV